MTDQVFVAITTTTIPEADLSLELIGPFDTYEDAQDFVDAIPESYPVPDGFGDSWVSVVAITQPEDPGVALARIALETEALGEEE